MDHATEGHQPVSELSGLFPPWLTRPASPTRPRSTTGAWVRPDGRRALQLVLATIWLLDGVLQLQAYFFTSEFGKSMISATAQGNPYVIAHPITWSGSMIAHHAVIADGLFATIQILLGLAIAWRPSVKTGLAASIVWALGVWWIGEGLGGVLSGNANPVNGAPGAVIIYALLAVLLWPRDRSAGDPPFIAARTVGPTTAKLLWLMLWGSLSALAVLGPNRSSQDLHNLIAAQAGGEPGWVAWIDRTAAGAVDHRGLAVTCVLAVLLAVVALGVYLPPRPANATIVLGIFLGATFWVAGQSFGSLFTHGATDVNSGPLLILLGVGYWRPISEAAFSTRTSIPVEGA